MAVTGHLKSSKLIRQLNTEINILKKSLGCTQTKQPGYWKLKVQLFTYDFKGFSNF